MRIFILLSLYIIPLISFGQHEVKVYFLVQDDYTIYDDENLRYLLADQVALRKSPDRKATAIATLPIGSALNLLQRSEETLTLNGIKSAWYEVLTDGKRGWIWGGLIAQHAFGSAADPTVKFVAGYADIRTGAEGEKLTTYQIRAFRHQTQLAKKLVGIEFVDLGPVYHYGNRGLEHVDDILYVHIPCRGGCGCMTGNKVVFWHHNTFTEVATLEEQADADYSTGAQLIFPSDMQGIPGLIIRRDSYPVEDEQTAGVFARKITKRFLRWDGKQMIPLKRDPEVKIYQMNEPND